MNDYCGFCKHYAIKTETINTGWKFKKKEIKKTKQTEFCKQHGHEVSFLFDVCQNYEEKIKETTQCQDQKVY